MRSRIRVPALLLAVFGPCVLLAGTCTGRNFNVGATMANNDLALPIHIYRQGVETFSVDNRLEPGQVTTRVYAWSPGEIEWWFDAGRDGVVLASARCDVDPRPARLELGWTGAALTCDAVAPGETTAGGASEDSALGAPDTP